MEVESESEERAKAFDRRCRCFCKEEAGKGSVAKGERSRPARKSVWERKRRARSRRWRRRGERAAGERLEEEEGLKRLVKRVVNFRRPRRKSTVGEVGAEGWLEWKTVRKAAGVLGMVVGARRWSSKGTGPRGRGIGAHDTICMRSSAWRFLVDGRSSLRWARAISRRVLVATWRR